MNGWRPMRTEDVAAVAAMSDAIHGSYTERAEVYAERLALYPAGCFLLAGEGEALGYLVSHPWRGTQQPALDRLLESLPAPADHYYLHDLALLPEARGSGAAQAAVGLVLDQARTAGFGRVALTAVNGADIFWRRQGFRPVAEAGAYGAGSLAMELLI
ncbi:GNAT family N-acetyltransferase [Sphingobium lactosutens]|uniref:GNAT family N-acetyltransferase n=1 Tax=Sphingobium lactosutens TaxID=522773 RepID=UPI0015BC46EA|nr:GNAT family N-acetyltransferase [Sphingobium lactosutens]NWK95184.1 GNAT family N-acetyltransferase [Sphingobium lactosutens]